MKNIEQLLSRFSREEIAGKSLDEANDIINKKLTGRDVMTLYVSWERLKDETSYWGMTIRELKYEIVIPALFEYLTEAEQCFAPLDNHGGL